MTAKNEALYEKAKTALRCARADYGVTHGEIARISGYSKHTINNFVQGYCSPKIAKAIIKAAVEASETHEPLRPVGSPQWKICHTLAVRGISIPELARAAGYSASSVHGFLYDDYKSPHVGRAIFGALGIEAEL